MSELLAFAVEWDRAAFLWVNRHMHGAVLDHALPCVTQLGLGQVQAAIVPLAAVLGAWRAGELSRPIRARSAWEAIRRRRAWVGPLLLAIVFAGLGSNIAKEAWVRERPWQFYHGYDGGGRELGVRIRTVPGVYPMKIRGFPSGHTATTCAVAAALTLTLRGRGRRRTLALAWLTAAVVAYSRMYLASHWPLDIIGGAVLGTAAGALAVCACRVWRRGEADQVTRAAEPAPDQVAP